MVPVLQVRYLYFQDSKITASFKWDQIARNTLSSDTGARCYLILLLAQLNTLSVTESGEMVFL